MIKRKGSSIIHFLVLFILLPGVLFSALTDCTRIIKENSFLFSIGSDGNPRESGGTTLRISESLLLCGQMLSQNRAKFNRLLRQFYAVIIFSLLFYGFNNVTIRKHQLHNYFPQEFLHILVFSLLLGGRAPPGSAS